jgi:tellurite resistance protein TerC
VLRGAMIATGTALIHAFDWMFYVFGAILIVSAARMLKSEEDSYDPGKSLMVRAVRKLIPVSETLEGQDFFTRVGGKLTATPLFVALILVDIADVVFAVDSIPAIFGITTDPFIVFTSNIFAILGLRSLYFLLAGAVQKFHYLKVGLSMILVFVGGKMLASSFFKIPIGVSLGVVALLLAGSIIASLVWPAAVKPAEGGAGLSGDVPNSP